MWADLHGCFYAKPDCSTAAATWALFFGTIGAFVAAALAAIYAAAIYGLEIVKRLGQAPCVDAKHLETCELSIFIEKGVEDLKITQFSNERPLFKGEDYSLIRDEFINLGRLPLVGVEVACVIYYQKNGQETSKSITAKIGNIPVDGLVHVATFVARELTPARICWESAKEGVGSKVEFHATPSDSERVSIEGILPSRQAESITLTREELESTVSAAASAAAQAAMDALLKRKFPR